MELTLKNLLLAGVGSMAYAVEKSSDVIEEMVNKGQLTVNQGRELNRELQNKFTAGRDKAAAIAQEIIKSINPATKEDIARLEARISQLEEQLTRQ